MCFSQSECSKHSHLYNIKLQSTHYLGFNSFFVLLSWTTVLFPCLKIGMFKEIVSSCITPCKSYWKTAPSSASLHVIKQHSDRSQHRKFTNLVHSLPESHCNFHSKTEHLPGPCLRCTHRMANLKHLSSPYVSYFPKSNLSPDKFSFFLGTFCCSLISL